MRKLKVWYVTLHGVDHPPRAIAEDRTTTTERQPTGCL
jgi:hypothetical protein